jgi:hypothetical protein
MDAVTLYLLQQLRVPAAPQGYATTNPSGITSTSGAMAGLGQAAAGALLYTPTLTGNIMVILAGLARTITAVAPVIITPKYGQTAAPAFNAAPTGTTWGPAGPFGIESPAAGWGVGFTANGRITGLTINSQTWIDLEVATGTAADAAEISSLTALIWETSQ